MGVEPTVAEPTVVEEPDEEPADDGDDEGEPPAIETEGVIDQEVDAELPDPDDVQQAEAVVEEDDFDTGGLFSGVEEGTRDRDEVDGEASEDDVADAFDDADLGPEMDPEDPAAMGQPDLADSGVAVAINEGAARLAVVGLEDPEKSDLEEEFTEVFEAFGLGKNGARFADEYLMIDDGEQVDPAWALASTAMACAIFAIYMRPDRDEQLDKLAGAVGNIGGAGNLDEFEGLDL